MATLRQIYKQRRPDGHFFDRDTMEFFGSKILSKERRMKDGTIYFRTSERNFDGTKRFHSVRRMDVEGNIEHIGDFCTMSSSQADRVFDNAVAEHNDRDSEEE